MRKPYAPTLHLIKRRILLLRTSVLNISTVSIGLRPALDFRSLSGLRQTNSRSCQCQMNTPQKCQLKIPQF